MTAPTNKLQLEMVREALPVPPARAVPAGYRVRQVEERDRGSYWRLFARVFNTHSRLDDLRTKALPGGFYVAEHIESGDVVASAVAAIYPYPRHRSGLSLQWVMTDEAHTGRGLGSAVVAAATERLGKAGGRAFLSTDDWRLPAISVYLKLGWKPLLFEPGMEPRWRSVFDLLNRNFSRADCAV